MQHCLQSGMPHRETKGKEKTPLVDPTTINPQNQLQSKGGK